MREGMKGRNFLRHLGLNGADRYFDANILFANVKRRRYLSPTLYRTDSSG